MFRMLFNTKEKMLELYNALEGENLGPDTEIEIVTLDSAIYMDIKNDLAFLVNGRLIIFAELQSTWCPNMALRILFYVSRTYEKYYGGKKLYSTSMIKIPTPKTYVFYEGTKDMPPESILRLSDMFIEKEAENSVEVVVKMINISYNKGAELLKRSKTMAEYSRFVQIAREEIEKNSDREAAMRAALLRSKTEELLPDFLAKHGTEVFGMLFDVVTKEEYGKLLEESGYDRGVEDGRRIGLETGRTNGRTERETEIALKMKASGFDAETIEKLTGLSAEKIEKL
nr:hypothetical protein [Clostridia bacterium]